jgi:hypothetical protein
MGRKMSLLDTPRKPLYNACNPKKPNHVKGRAVKDEHPYPEIPKIDNAPRLAGVACRWLYRRTWSGNLPASRVGGFLLVH